MNYMDEAPDDTDEEARMAAIRAMSPLSAAVPRPVAVPRPASSFAASLPLAYRPYADMLAASNAAMKTEVYDPQRKRLEEYTKELKARRAGPTSAERLYEIGAALLSPTKSQGFGGTVSNLAPVMAAQRKASREAEDAQRELALKYDLEIGNLSGEEAKARILGESGLFKSIMAAQLKAGKGAPPMRGLVDTLGKARHPSLGYELPEIGDEPGQVPMAAIEFMLSSNNPAVDMEFNRKYKAPGYAKYIRDYYGSNNEALSAASPVDESEE